MLSNNIMLNTCVWILIIQLHVVTVKTLKIGLRKSTDFDYLNALTVDAKKTMFNTSEAITFEHYVFPIITSYGNLSTELTRLKNAAFDFFIGPDDVVGFQSTAQTIQLPYYVNEISLTSELLKPDGKWNNGHSTVMLADLTDMNMVQASMDIVHKIGQRKKVVILTNSDIDKTGYLLALSVNLQLYYMYLNSTWDAIQIRNELIPMREAASPEQSAYMIVVDSSSHSLVETVLEGASYLSMLNNQSIWIISSLFLSKDYIMPFYATGAKIYTFRPKNTALSTRQDYKHEILVNCIKHFLLAKSNPSNTTTFMQNLIHTRLVNLNGILTFDNITRQNYFMEFGLMETDRSKSSDLVKIAIWNSNNKPHKFSSNQTIEAVPVIQIIAILEPPFVTNSSGTGPSTFAGFSLSLLDEVRKSVNFDYNITLFTEGRIGSYNSTTKTWNGIMGELVNNRAEMSLNLLSKTKIRAEEKRVIIGDVAVMLSGKVMLIHIPERGNDLLKPLYPLTWNVWFAIILAFLILSATLYATDKISPNDRRFSIREALFFVYSSFVMSKLPRNPIKPSARIFILILWFASLMYVFTYATNFFFMILLKDESVQFDSIGGLKNYSNKYYWGIISGGATQAFFENGTGVYKEMWIQGNIEFPNKMLVRNLAEGTNRLILENNNPQKPVIIGDDSSLSYIANNNCSLKLVGEREEVDRTGLHFFFSTKLDPNLRTAIDKKLQELNDDGTIDRLKERYWAVKKCSSAANLIDQKDLKPVEFSDVGGIFLVLGVGCVLALIIAIIEFIIRKLRLSCQRFQNNTNLYFKRRYDAVVKRIVDTRDQKGIFVKIKGVKDEQFMPNCELHPVHGKNYDSHQLEISVGDEIRVEYLGNDRITGKRMFKKVN